MEFEVIGEITNRETIARGQGIRELKRLQKLYGRGNWRKVKGVAQIRFSDGSIHRVELHWYESHGVGKQEMKIKYWLD